ncbi:MAG TPA: ABC transporter ATP-binding protein [Longimicrobium sp.]|nr:ABC transporter ATP-binding protein [Longimicrobium sp.]
MELKIERLSKTYPNGVHALRNVSLTIAPGMFGLLGPNGAGKSTLMRILATLQEADSGRAALGDIDVLRDKEAVRRTLGYLPQEFGLYPRATAEEMLDHFAVLKGVTDNRERRDTVQSLLEQTNLWDARHRRLGTFSGGMRQRFGIAVALIGNPRLIIVDEPTAGLDPAERARFLNLLSELGENAVVILSTHIVEDVSDLCQRMAIIRDGQILLEAEPQAAVQAVRGRVWRREVPREEVERYKESLISTTLVGGRTVVHVHGDSPPDDSFQPVEPDLKDVYFTVMRGFSIHRPEPEPELEDTPVRLDDFTPRPPDFARPVSQDPAPSVLGSLAPPLVDAARPSDAAAQSRGSSPIASNDTASPSSDDSPPPNEPPAASDGGAPVKEEDPWALFRRPGSSA